MKNWLLLQEYYLQLNFTLDCSVLFTPGNGGVFCHAEIFSLYSDLSHSVAVVLTLMTWILRVFHRSLVLFYSLLMFVSLQAGTVAPETVLIYFFYL